MFPARTHKELSIADSITDLAACWVSHVFCETCTPPPAAEASSECNIPRDWKHSASLDSFIHCVASFDVSGSFLRNRNAHRPVMDKTPEL